MGAAFVGSTEIRPLLSLLFIVSRWFGGWIRWGKGRSVAAGLVG